MQGKQKKRTKESIHHVYDKFYKSLFSYSKILEEFITLFFPELARYINFKKAKQLKTSFVNSEYADREADIVYSIPVAGRNVYIYILIEHQSTVDKKICLRLLEYQLGLWNSLIKKGNANPLELPIIIPIVIYNGMASWTIPRDFKKSFKKAPSVFKKFIPAFQYLFFDVNKISTSTLTHGNEIIKIGLFIDKNKKNIDEIIATYAAQISNPEIDQELVKEFLKISYYFITYHSKKTPEQLVIDFEQMEIDIEIKKEIIRMSKSTAMQLIQRGINQGIEQGINQGYERGINQGYERGINQGIEQGIEQGFQNGIEKGNEEKAISVAQQLLELNTDIQFIAKITGLSEEKILSLKPR